MRKTAVITARLDAETMALVDRVTAAQGRTRSSFAADAIAQAVRNEVAYLAFVQEGIDDIDAGRFIENDVVMAELDTMIARHRARCEG